MQSITVVISTDGQRPEKLLACIESIKKNTYQKFSLLVLQQSRQIIKLPSWIITYQVPMLGVSYAKNIAIQNCQSDIIVFTDDDCLVDKNWLKQIATNFRQTKAVAVYGKVIPYQPNLNVGLICPSYLLKDKPQLTNYFTINKTHFGIGNNAAFKTQVIKQLGGFAEWLGPGKITKAAEDVELLFRLFMSHHYIKYDSKVVVSHNRWLTVAQNRDLYHLYFRGMLAAYTYHLLLGSKWSYLIVRRFWKAKLVDIFAGLKLFFKAGKWQNLAFDLKDVANFLLGMGLGIMEFLKDHNKPNLKVLK